MFNAGDIGLAIKAGLQRGHHAGRIVGVHALAPFVGSGADVGVGITKHFLVTLRVKRHAGLQMPVPQAVAEAIDGNFPVLAPLGTAETPLMPFSKVTQTSKVGNPRESNIS